MQGLRNVCGNTRSIGVKLEFIRLDEIFMYRENIFF